MFMSKTSHQICIVLAFSTRKVLLVSIYIVMIGLVMQPCLKYMQKKNDRSHSPLVLTSHILQEFSCHNEQQVIAINSKLLQQTPITMKIFVAHYCNNVCGNRLLPKKKKKNTVSITFCFELSIDCSSREFLVLFWNNFGVRNICMFTSKTSYYICIVLAFSTRKVVLVSIYIVMIGLVMQPCLKYMEKKNDRSRSPLVLTFHILQESSCHNDQQVIAINSKLLQQTLVATKFLIALNSKLLQQTLITMQTNSRFRTN